MSGSYLSTIANAVKFSDQVPITSSKNTIAVALLIASSLVFIQRHGKMKTLLRSLSGKMYKCCNQRSAVTTMTGRMEEEDDLELDCVVCLSRVSPGEKYKILQTCKHGFHVNCIDTWLKKHSSTCPICRCSVPQTPRNYCSISAQDQDFDALISYLLRFLDHVQTWLMNPLNALTEECLRLP